MSSNFLKDDEEPGSALDPANTEQPQAVSENIRLQPASEQEHKEAPAVQSPRLESLAAKQARLEKTLASLQAQRATLVAEAKLPSGLAMPDSWSDEEKTDSALKTAKAVVKQHSDLLHKYNEIKDIGQGLMGLIADQRGVRMATVMEEYGMSEKD